MDEISDHLEPENSKDRHGCVTAWLILMIVVNSLSALSYVFLSDTIVQSLPNQPSMVLIWMVGGLSVLNVIFAIMLFQWKKIGFYGFVATAALAFVVNLSMGLGIAQSIAGLFGIAILYGILQIKGKAGNTAWSGLR